MITVGELTEILELYRKHGWEISRVLATEDLKSRILPQIDQNLVDINSIADSDIDAVWLYRKRKDGDISWEIRLLSKSPFALCESFPATASNESIEAAKKNMEHAIRDRASK